MKKKVYYLSTCDTCKRIIKEVGVDEQFEQQDIKAQHISGEELDELKEKVGSYEELVNKFSRKYKAEGYKNQDLGEADWREIILSDYTLLKRPVFVLGDEVLAGNNKKTVEAVKATLALLT